MTPERWQQVKELLEVAWEWDAAERSGFLDQACAGDRELRAQVDALLASDEDIGEFLASPAIGQNTSGCNLVQAALAESTAANGAIEIPATTHQVAIDLPKPDGSRIGPYDILRELGKGGMGIVYLCRRADGVYSRPVALKVLRSDYASADFLHRFDQERRILESLSHPNIARLFDGGRTPGGLPFWRVPLSLATLAGVTL